MYKDIDWSIPEEYKNGIFFFITREVFDFSQLRMLTSRIEKQSNYFG